MTQDSPRLFESTKLKDLELKNRIVMAPMTRLRAFEDGTPSEPMTDYYAQRASAGLIVTEATMVSPMSHGYMFCPGIFEKRHVDGWRAITKAVHQGNGRIFLQLWHSGRIAHPSLLDGAQPLAPSALAAKGTLHTPIGKVELSVPQELGREAINVIVGQFASAAQMARNAEFDGVEIHAAFGYLIDQFLQDVSNQRSDDYGGSIANRVKFLEEVVAAVVAIFPHRTGIKLSPSNTFYGMGDSDPYALFHFVLERLNHYDLAYVHLMEPNETDLANGTKITEVCKTFRSSCRHPLVVNGGFDKQKAEMVLDANDAELISFGRPFIANPDLPFRLANGLSLNDAHPSCFYGKGPDSTAGYIDFSPAESTSGQTQNHSPEKSGR